MWGEVGGRTDYGGGVLLGFYHYNMQKNKTKTKTDK